MGYVMLYGKGTTFPLKLFLLSSPAVFYGNDKKLCAVMDSAR